MEDILLLLIIFCINRKQSDGFIIVYAVSDEISFDACLECHNLLLHSKTLASVSIPKILAGNKSDYKPPEERKKKKKKKFRSNKARLTELAKQGELRSVTFAQGKKLSKKFGLCSFLECSAKSGENTEFLIADLVRLIRQNNKVLDLQSKQARSDYIQTTKGVGYKFDLAVETQPLTDDRSSASDAVPSSASEKAHVTSDTSMSEQRYSLSPTSAASLANIFDLNDVKLRDAERQFYEDMEDEDFLDLVEDKLNLICMKAKKMYARTFKFVPPSLDFSFEDHHKFTTDDLRVMTESLTPDTLWQISLTATSECLKANIPNTIMTGFVNLVASKAHNIEYKGVPITDIIEECTEKLPESKSFLRWKNGAPNEERKVRKEFTLETQDESPEEIDSIEYEDTVSEEHTPSDPNLPDEECSTERLSPKGSKQNVDETDGEDKNIDETNISTKSVPFVVNSRRFV